MRNIQRQYWNAFALAALRASLSWDRHASAVAQIDFETGLRYGNARVRAIVPLVQPLPTVLGFSPRALTAPQFHIARQKAGFRMRDPKVATELTKNRWTYAS
jgi:hypothetical protein